MMNVPALALVVFAPLTPAPIGGETATVDTVEDVVDFAQPRTIAELPGPDGRVSLREAVIAANNTAGPQTVAFAVPMDEWWLVNDMAVLRFETLGVNLTDDGTTLDFTTQTDFSGDTNPDGPEVGIYGVHPNYYGTAAISIYADNCIVRGLGAVWNRVSVAIRSGSGNRVAACVTSSIEVGDSVAPGASFNVIGGTDPADANVLDDVQLECFADDNQVIGNQLRTVRVIGSQFCTRPSRNRVGGSSTEERNVISGFGYFSSEGFPLGEGVEVYWAQDTIVEGNIIGLSPDGGSLAPGNGPIGVEVADSVDTTVRENLIAGMRVEGINHYAGQVFGRAIQVNAINADNVGVVVQGNTIGTDAGGSVAIPTLNGILVSSATATRASRDVVLGGLEPGEGNTIAFVEATGVGVSHPSPNTEISGNSIHSSGALGIDLGPVFGVDGVTPNDAGDLDTNGGNELQNFPDLLRAYRIGNSVRVAGRLSSQAARPYRIEFFANPSCDASGYGEGKTLVGSLEVDTDARGQAPFVAGLASPAAAGDWMTATATDLLTGATSEFSACIAARGRSIRTH
jgi:hypothetical protein